VYRCIRATLCSAPVFWLPVSCIGLTEFARFQGDLLQYQKAKFFQRVAGGWLVLCVGVGENLLIDPLKPIGCKLYLSEN